MNPDFAYVYDEILSDKRFTRDVEQIENELARRGIEGSTVKASVLCEAKQIVKQFVRQSVKNVVLVGSDHLLQAIIELLPEIDVTLGFLPVGPSLIGGLLGIPSGPKAVDVIAARLVENLDLAQINDRPFLFEVTAPDTLAGIDVHGEYRLRPSVRGAIAIRNLASGGEGGGISNPVDGMLEIVLQAEAQTESKWGWRKKTLTETKVFLATGTMQAAEPFRVFIDGQAYTGALFTFSILPKKIQLITGKRLSD